MTRAAGRRIARTPSRPSGHDLPRLLAALVLALLTVGALFAAGRTDHATGPRPVAGSRLDLGARSFSCTGGLPGVTGTAGPVGTAGVRVNGHRLSDPAFPVPHPTTVVADRGAARRAFAVQTSHGPRWLAAVSCPEPRPVWWFVGTGAGDRHAGVLTVSNPRPGTAIFDVDVIGPDGPVEAPGLHGLTLAEGHDRTIDLNRMAAASGDVAVRVRASQGLVAASVAERWAPALIGKQGRAWVAPQPAPSRKLDLVGLPRASGATLVVANPGPREAVVGLHVVSDSGTFEPTRHATVNVPAGAVRDVEVGDVLDAKSSALRLSATVPVAATVRSTRGTAEAYATAGRRLSGTSVVGVPRRARSQLVLASLGEQPARVRVQVSAADDHRLLDRRLQVSAGEATTLKLPRKALAVQLSTSGGEVAGSVTSRSTAGIAAVPVAPAVAEQRRPGVLPAW